MPETPDPPLTRAQADLLLTLECYNGGTRPYVPDGPRRDQPPLDEPRRSRALDLAAASAALDELVRRGLVVMEPCHVPGWARPRLVAAGWKWTGKRVRPFM